MGPNGTQLTANDGATFYISDEMIQKNPTYLFAPQCPGKNWTDPDTVTALKSAIDSYVAAHRIDPDRIYIEGMSMGGTGVWNMILAYPYYFAAAIPMCGMVPAQWYNVPGAFEAIKNTPVWAYHCKDDPEMPEARDRQGCAGPEGCRLLLREVRGLYRRFHAGAPQGLGAGVQHRHPL